MRAREFITEAVDQLPLATGDPLQHAYYIPDIRNNDAYHTYRLGVAMARARANRDEQAKQMPALASQSAFAQNAIVVGFNDGVEEVLDQALGMLDMAGKKAVGSVKSEEPFYVNAKSIVKPFKGYPR